MNYRSCLLLALGLFVCDLFHASLLAQTTDWPSTAMPPLVLRDTRPDEWPDLRGRIETRLKRYLGERPPAALAAEVKFEELARDEIAGLTRIRYRYHVIDDSWTEARTDPAAGATVSTKGPYAIAYGSLVPKKAGCENLFVPVCVSSTHITYGSIRMEPVLMILGQSAATSAVMAIDSKIAVQDVPYAVLRTRLLAARQVVPGDESRPSQRSR